MSISTHPANFNPRSREGSDNLQSVGRSHGISIHAPVKGATVDQHVADQVEPISIHAPVKGATLLRRMQPVALPGISIHAPVKGATGDDHAQVPGR